MKRSLCIFLAALLICAVMACPALAAGDSMSDPVEIIDTTTPTDPPANEERIQTQDVPTSPYNEAQGESWSLVNLLSAALTTVFGGLATGEAVKIKNKKEDLTLGDEKFTVLKKEKKSTENGVINTVTELVRKSPLWKAGSYDLATSAASIATFLATEDMTKPMTMVDRWTPLMVGILAVGAGVYGVTAGGKKLDSSLVEKLKNSTKTSV